MNYIFDTNYIFFYITTKYIGNISYILVYQRFLLKLGVEKVSKLVPANPVFSIFLGIGKLEDSQLVHANPDFLTVFKGEE